MNFEKNCDVLKPKSSCILLSKKIKFNKTRWNRKWKILHIVLERWTLCFCSCKNCKLKKSVMRLTHEKKEGIFSPFVFSEGNFFRQLFFISIYSVLNTISEYTYLYISKNIIPCTSILDFEGVKSFQCILKHNI